MAARAFPGRTAILVLAAGGALAALWLERIHYRAHVAPGEESLCALGGALDCTSVALSKYAVLFGVPLPAWGLVGFCSLAFCAWRGSRWLLPLAACAALAGMALTAVSAWSIGAWCLVCEAVHALSLAIFGCTWRSRRWLAPAYAAGDALVVAAPALGTLLAVRLFVPAYFSVPTYDSALPFAHGRTEGGDPWIGAEQPALTLQEFVDYTCPHCRLASARSLQRLAAHSKELRIVRRHWPRIPCQPPSDTRCLPLRMAFCADEQDRFWQADRWLFDHSQAGAMPDIGAAAHDLGLDRERLAACVSRASTFDRAAAEWKRARKLHLPGTPYYALGDRIVTAAAASALIDAL